MHTWTFNSKPEEEQFVLVTINTNKSIYAQTSGRTSLQNGVDEISTICAAHYQQEQHLNMPIYNIRCMLQNSVYNTSLDQSFSSLNFITKKIGNGLGRHTTWNYNKSIACKILFGQSLLRYLSVRKLAKVMSALLFWC